MPKPKKLTGIRAAATAPSELPVASSEPIHGSYQPAVAEANARYAEYLRVLDEVPVLLDVVSEPPRVVVRDFRLGQRPNVRRAARVDAYAVREQQAEELVCSYVEYELQPGHDGADTPTVHAPAGPKVKRPKGARKSKRRKR